MILPVSMLLAGYRTGFFPMAVQISMPSFEICTVYRKNHWFWSGCDCSGEYCAMTWTRTPCVTVSEVDMGEALQRTVRRDSAVPRLLHGPSRCGSVYITRSAIHIKTEDLGVGTSQRSAIGVRRSAGEPRLLLNVDH